MRLKATAPIFLVALLLSGGSLMAQTHNTELPQRTYTAAHGQYELGPVSASAGSHFLSIGPDLTVAGNTWDTANTTVTLTLQWSADGTNWNDFVQETFATGIRSKTGGTPIIFYAQTDDSWPVSQWRLLATFNGSLTIAWAVSYN